MKKRWMTATALCCILVSGCSREEELGRQFDAERAMLVASADSLTRMIDQRDRHFDEVVRAINDVYFGLETVREKEQLISHQTGETEGKYSPTSDQARSDLLNQIADIGSTISENKKKLAGLQSTIRTMNKEFAGLTETLRNLERLIAEREQTIAQLDTKVRGLEGAVAERDQQIAEQDRVIGTQESALNTVYYVAGTRSELREKGIIANEGGFPFGLFGSTTVLASGLDTDHFSELDLRNDHVIQVSGEIDEIVPMRDEQYFSMNVLDDVSSDITIIDPDRFWRERYLVIITD